MNLSNQPARTVRFTLLAIFAGIFLCGCAVGSKTKFTPAESSSGLVKEESGPGHKNETVIELIVKPTAQEKPDAK